MGLGTALYQEQEGQIRVTAYASRVLCKRESHYHAHKLEFLARKWAVTKKLCDYQFGSQFSDSSPLIYAVSYRWLAALSMFNF